MIYSVEVGETGRRSSEDHTCWLVTKTELSSGSSPAGQRSQAPRLYFHFLHSLQRACDAEGQGCQTKKQTKIPTKISWLFYEA